MLFTVPMVLMSIASVANVTEATRKVRRYSKPRPQDAGVLLKAAVRDLLPERVREEIARTLNTEAPLPYDPAKVRGSLCCLLAETLAKQGGRFLLNSTAVCRFPLKAGMLAHANKTLGFAGRTEMLSLSFEHGFEGRDGMTDVIAAFLNEDVKSALVRYGIAIGDDSYDFATITPSQGKKNEAFFALSALAGSEGFARALHGGATPAMWQHRFKWIATKLNQSLATALSSCQLAHELGLPFLNVRNIVCVDDVDVFVDDENLVRLDNVSGRELPSDGKPHKVAISDGLSWFVYDDAKPFARFIAQVRSLCGMKGIVVSIPFSKVKEKLGESFCDVTGRRFTLRPGMILAHKSAIKNADLYAEFYGRDPMALWISHNSLEGKMPYLGICNLWREGDMPEKKSLSDQTISSLVGLTEKLNKALLAETKAEIEGLSKAESLLSTLCGSDDNADNRDGIAALLRELPVMLKAGFVRQMAQDKLDSIRNDAKAGRVRVNGTYLPAYADPIVCLSAAFGHDLAWAKKNALIQRDRVYCPYVTGSREVSILRNPHIFFAHLIMRNSGNAELREWFGRTPGVCFGGLDTASLHLSMDFDGDIVLISTDRTLITAIKKTVALIGNKFPVYDHPKAEKFEVPLPGTKEFSRMQAASSEYGRINNQIGHVSTMAACAWARLNSQTDFSSLKAKRTIHDLMVLEMLANLYVDASKTDSVPTDPAVIANLEKRYKRSPLFRAWRTVNKYHSFEQEMTEHSKAYEQEGNGIGDANARLVESEIPSKWNLENPDKLGDFNHRWLCNPNMAIKQPRKARIVDTLYAQITESIDVYERIAECDAYAVKQMMKRGDGKLWEPHSKAIWVKLTDRNDDWTIGEFVHLLSLLNATFWRSLHDKEDENDEISAEERTFYTQWQDARLRKFVARFMVFALDTQRKPDGSFVCKGVDIADAEALEAFCFAYAGEMVARQTMRYVMDGTDVTHKKFCCRVFGHYWAENVRLNRANGAEIVEADPDIFRDDLRLMKQCVKDPALYARLVAAAKSGDDAAIDEILHDQEMMNQLMQQDAETLFNEEDFRIDDFDF